MGDFVDIGKHHYDKMLHCIRSQALFMIDHLIMPTKYLEKYDGKAIGNFCELIEMNHKAN